MANVFQSLLLVIAGATEKELARQVKYLKVENEVLRAKLPKRITISMSLEPGSRMVTTLPSWGANRRSWAAVIEPGEIATP